jgi:hypothetical protein
VLGMSEGLGETDRAQLSGADGQEEARRVRAVALAGALLRVLEEVPLVGRAGWTWEVSWRAGLPVYEVTDGTGTRIVIAA